MKHLYQSFLLAIAMLVAVVFPAQAAPYPQYTIAQGDKVVIDGNTCTIGYVDKIKRKAYIANHCAPTGKTVNVHDPQLGILGQITGTYPWGSSQEARYDVAVIDIYDSVKILDNKYSGDKRARNLDVQRGDKLCMYSRMQNAINCGTVRIVDGNIIAADQGASGEKGDSGGPAWVPGKGFVGIYSMIIGDNYSNLFTSIDEDVTCANGENYYWDTPKDNRVRIADHDCPRTQLAPYSPDIVQKRPLQDPHPILFFENGKYIPADKRFGGVEYNPETMRPGSPIQQDNIINVNHGNTTSSTDSWVTAIFAIIGVVIAMIPIIQTVMGTPLL